MNAGIQPPGGGGGGVALTNLNNKFSNQLLMLMMQYGADPTDPQQRAMFEAMLKAMSVGQGQGNVAGPTPGSTTSAPNYGTYEPSWVEQIGINRREGIVKKSEGIQGGGGGGGMGMPFSPKINRDEPKQPNQGNGSKENKVGIGDPNTPPMSNDELAGLVDSYKQANAGRGIFRPGAPPTTTPPTTAPPGGTATGAGFGMGNYTGASLAEMLQELLGGGFRGGWGRGQRA